MLPDAFIVHASGDRLRLRVPSRKGKKDYFSFLRTGLADYPGVKSIEVNPTTASVLLFHNLNLEAFAEHAVIDGFFRLKTSTVQVKPVYARAVEPIASLDERLKQFTSGEMDIASVAFMSLVGLGIYQISRGNIAAPAWHTALWYAMNTVLMARNGKNRGGVVK